MAGTGTKLPSVRDFADTAIKKLVDNGTLQPAPDAAQKAALTPTFTKGTVALDEETGQPIIPTEQREVPAFTEGDKRKLHDGSTVITSPTGAIVHEPAPSAATPPAPSVPVEAAPQAASAAETTAAAIAEEMADFEFDDPDLGVKIPVRVPKQFLETAKRGYGRRAGYDRAVSYLKNAEPTLRQLVESGELNQILPAIQAALTNQQYREYVAKGYQRLQRGESLIEQARTEAVAAAQEHYAPSPAVDTPLESFGDPLLDAIAASTRPLQDKIAAMERRQQDLDAQRDRETATMRQQQEQQANRAVQMQAAHADLAAAFPGEFDPGKGPADPGWQRACEFARDAGYINTYDLRAAIVFGGQQIMQIARERAAAISSPVADALDTQLVATAHAQAAAAARTVSGGGARTVAPTPPPPKPSRFEADGKTMKSKEIYMAEVLKWHQQYGRLQGT